ncbi:MAG: nucleotidyltransferase domain-containing protein [Nanoarchaeota archaeon]
MQELKFIKFVEFFIINPYKEVYIRELAKKLKISPFATKKYADVLVKEGLILEEKRANLRYLKANVKNLFYKHSKITYSIRHLLKSELIEFLKRNIANLTSITLFGSLAKGEDNEESDIDLLIIGKEKRLNLSEFENKLNKEITLHFFSWSEWNSKAKEDHPFYYEIINHGIPLYGELPLTKWR